MKMNYVSTRGKAEPVSSAQAILQGIAGDGGLFVPSEIPKTDPEFIESLTGLSYGERAKKILGLFLEDYSEDEIARCVEGAYGGGKFDTPETAPVKCVGDMSVLELWHGPTSAFKDMALQLLPRLLSEALKKAEETKETLILVATSGDTGKAALAGFADVPQTKIMVFYPDGGVSDMQKLQMATQQGGNVSVVAVKGNFDDAQSGVKEIFGDEAFASELADAASAKKVISPALKCKYETDLVEKLSGFIDEITEKTEVLEGAIAKVHCATDIVEESAYIRDRILPAMTELRVPCDAAETFTAKKYWPFPTYADLLFGVK